MQGCNVVVCEEEGNPPDAKKPVSRAENRFISEGSAHHTHWEANGSTAPTEEPTN